MNTIQFKRSLQMVLGLLFLGLFACEKDAVNPTFPTPQSSDGPHMANPVSWLPCSPGTAYQLLDANYNPKPVGYVEAGQVMMSATLDTLQIEVPVNAYWSVTSVAWRMAADESQLSNASWQVIAFTPSTSYAEVRIPKGQLVDAAIQVDVQCQKFNLSGAAVFDGTMSPFTHTRQDGSRYIQYSFPQTCCPTNCAVPGAASN